MSNNYTVYMHKFPNNKIYIGITKRNPNIRWGECGENYRGQTFINRAIQKYGWDNIQHIILATNLSKEWACKIEQDLIFKYHSNDRNYGYNMTSGGEGRFNSKPSKETIEKISKSKSGKKLSEEHRRKIGDSGRGKKKPPMSEEMKEHLRQINTGKKYSEASKLKRKETMEKKKQNGWKRKPLSDEAKEHLRQINLGKHHSEETRKKMSESRKGKKHKPMDDATKKKIREAVKQQWSEHRTWYYKKEE
jgi:hypothetical protein